MYARLTEHPSSHPSESAYDVRLSQTETSVSPKQRASIADISTVHHGLLGESMSYWALKSKSEWRLTDKTMAATSPEIVILIWVMASSQLGWSSSSASFPHTKCGPWDYMRLGQNWIWEVQEGAIEGSLSEDTMTLFFSLWWWGWLLCLDCRALQQRRTNLCKSQVNPYTVCNIHLSVN